MNSAERKFLPYCVTEFKEFESVAGTNTADDVKEYLREDSQLIDENVCISQNIDLEMVSDDVEELIDEHHEELMTEELQQFQEKRKKTLTKEIVF